LEFLGFRCLFRFVCFVCFVCYWLLLVVVDVDDEWSGGGAIEAGKGV